MWCEVDHCVSIQKIGQCILENIFNMKFRKEEQIKMSLMIEVSCVEQGC